MNLSELFATHKGTRTFEQLAKATNGKLTSQRLQQLATTQPKQFPTPESVTAIARALGVREVVVLLAVAESLGLDVGRELPRLVQVLPATASRLSDEEVAALVNLIRVFKPEEVVGNAEHPAPKNVVRPHFNPQPKRADRRKSAAHDDETFDIEEGQGHSYDA